MAAEGRNKIAKASENASLALAANVFRLANRQGLIYTPELGDLLRPESECVQNGPLATLRMEIHLILPAFTFG